MNNNQAFKEACGLHFMPVCREIILRYAAVFFKSRGADWSIDGGDPAFCVTVRFNGRGIAQWQGDDLANLVTGAVAQVYYMKGDDKVVQLKAWRRG